MNIYYDARWIGDHGIGRVARELDQSLRLPHLNIGGIPTSPFDTFRFLFAIMFRTPKDACVFSPGYNAPLFLLRPYVFIIHDLNHIDRAENSSFLKRIYYKVVMRRACHNATAILTVSEYSKRRIVEWSNVNPARVVNVGSGVDQAYSDSGDVHLPGYSYLFCVSNRRAHKNEQRILEAFAGANLNTSIRLVLTGLPTDALRSLAERLGVADRLVFAGRVPECDLPSYYRGAIALVFPSLYEGFGLPVIEAMACGTPVLTSNTTSLPEAAGTAALLVDPLSVADISQGMERLCKDAGFRRFLINAGFQQARKFSWDRVTDKVKEVLRMVCEKKEID